jgi:hypothetical protein
MSDDDPTASKEWNEGCDFAMRQLCSFLGVDPMSVSWDAATETVEGDVCAVIGNILRAKLGENWGPDQTSAEIDVSPRMWKLGELIAKLQSVLDQFGNTCVYIRRGGVGWGALALNREADDKKHGVFDLHAQHDRDMNERLEQIGRLRKRLEEAETALRSVSGWRQWSDVPRDGKWIIALCNDHSQIYRIYAVEGQPDLWTTGNKTFGGCLQTYGEGLFCAGGCWIPDPDNERTPRENKQ